MKNHRLVVTIALFAAIIACRADEQPPGFTTSGDPRVDSIIGRDLTAYFSQRGGSRAQVSYEYLRSGPTITGIAYPKYYVWVRSTPTAGGAHVEGPARVALIDSVAEVTHFFAHDSGSVAPAQLDSVFPSPVVAIIRRHYWK